MSAESKKSSFKNVKNFIPEVRQEINKVTWPTRKETMLTSAFVFIFAMIAAIYFLLVDQAIYRVVQFILNLGR